MKRKEEKREKHGRFQQVGAQIFNYQLVRSSKPNLEISYEMDNNWGWNHEIDARV